MKSLSIHVDALAGTDVLGSCNDMVALSKQLDMLVTAYFNGEYMIANPKITGQQLMEQYNRAIDRKIKKRKQD